MASIEGQMLGAVVILLTLLLLLVWVLVLSVKAPAENAVQNVFEPKEGMFSIRIEPAHPAPIPPKLSKQTETTIKEKWEAYQKETNGSISFLEWYLDQPSVQSKSDTDHA